MKKLVILAIMMAVLTTVALAKGNLTQFKTTCFNIATHQKPPVITVCMVQESKPLDLKLISENEEAFKSAIQALITSDPGRFPNTAWITISQAQEVKEVYIGLNDGYIAFATGKGHSFEGALATLKFP